MYDETGSVEVGVEVGVMGAVIVFAHVVAASIYLVIKGEDGGLRRRQGVLSSFSGAGKEGIGICCCCCL